MRLDRVGNGRKLPRFCGNCGFTPVECGKCEISKQRNSLFLRLFGPGLLKWGSGGRWFESSRPDFAEGSAETRLTLSLLFTSKQRLQFFCTDTCTDKPPPATNWRGRQATFRSPVG